MMKKQKRQRISRQERRHKEERMAYSFLAIGILFALLVILVVIKNCNDANQKERYKDQHAVVEWEEVNLREGPSKDIITSLDKRTEVILTGNYYTDLGGLYDWVEVEVQPDSLKGWVAIEALQFY